MVTAAKTVSQLGTHMAIAFTLMYAFTGSIAFGGLAAMVEPVCNVALLPVHQGMWLRIRTRWACQRQTLLLAVAGEKISQTAMHMGVAFAVMYWASGSIAFGGAAAILEPIGNVILMPFHDRAWERLRERLDRNMAAS